jgi:Fur family ferric uptake transcriptional regulator
VYEQAKDRLPGLNRTTVYRTLEALHDADVVDIMHSPLAAEVRFSARKPHQRHAHLVCRRCDAEFEISLSALLDLAHAVERKTGFRMDVDHLTLEGLCEPCARSGVPEAPPPPTASPSPGSGLPEASETLPHGQ